MNDLECTERGTVRKRKRNERKRKRSSVGAEDEREKSYKNRQLRRGEKCREDKNKEERYKTNDDMHDKERMDV